MGTGGGNLQQAAGQEEDGAAAAAEEARVPLLAAGGESGDAAGGDAAGGGATTSAYDGLPLPAVVWRSGLWRVLAVLLVYSLGAALMLGVGRSRLHGAQQSRDSSPPPPLPHLPLVYP